jgi:hypothetical protein
MLNKIPLTSKDVSEITLTSVITEYGIRNNGLNISLALDDL